MVASAAFVPAAKKAALKYHCDRLLYMYFHDFITPILQIVKWDWQYKWSLTGTTQEPVGQICFQVPFAFVYKFMHMHDMSSPLLPHCFLCFLIVIITFLSVICKSLRTVPFKKLGWGDPKKFWTPPPGFNFTWTPPGFNFTLQTCFSRKSASRPPLPNRISNGTALCGIHTLRIVYHTTHSPTQYKQ